MAISNFIPTVWSTTLYKELDGKYIAVKHCNRDFEGDIKSKGSTVKICGVGDVTVFDYTKNTDMTAPQTLSDSAQTLTINKAKAFNFQIDDVDRAQAMPRLMQQAMRRAASALASDADSYIFGLVGDATTANTVTEASPTSDNVIDALMKARTILSKSGVTDASDMVFEVSPEIAELILKAKIKLATDNESALENGCIGNICGVKVYVSNNVVKTAGENSKVIHKCVARSKRAVAYAEQLSEIEAYRPEKRFADAVKGLHLYGAKLIYPNEYVALHFTLA